jgi:hypothetical protein
MNEPRNISQLRAMPMAALQEYRKQMRREQNEAQRDVDFATTELADVDAELKRRVHHSI